MFRVTATPSHAARRARPRRANQLAALVASIALFHVTAGAQPLLQGPEATVSADDVRAAAQRIPGASRDALLSRPENVVRQAEDLYVRRALAAEARRDGLDKDPVVAALLRQAQERILSDARLAEIDIAALPSDELVARYARDLYRENPARFNAPAQTRARHILIGRSDDGKARERAEALLAQLKDGASFEALAREQSADLATASRGGDLGWFASGAMVPEFEQALAALENPGDLSGIVETRFGFHIVRLEGRRAAGQRSFDDVRGELEREVRAKAQAEARQAKVRELLGGAKPDTAAIEAFSRSFAKP